MSEIIEWNDFTKVDMRVGKIIDVKDFPEARKPAYILTVDFGPLGVRKTSAQVTNYKHEELQGREVVAVFNFPAKQIGPIMFLWSFSLGQKWNDARQLKCYSRFTCFVKRRLF